MTRKQNTRKFKIYPSITTTKGDYKKQIKEATALGLKSVCLFPTAIDFPERKKLYRFIENSSVRQIPFVHIRHDMREKELQYFIKHFKTQVFNIHSQTNNDFPLQYDLSSYNKIIYVETTLSSFFDDFDEYAGICLDTAHVENQRLKKTKLYESFMHSLNTYPIGITHISAISKNPRHDNGEVNYDIHKFDNLGELDYVARYKKYLSKIVALELENSIEEQLEAKSHLENLLNSS